MKPKAPKKSGVAKASSIPSLVAETRSLSCTGAAPQHSMSNDKSGRKSTAAPAWIAADTLATSNVLTGCGLVIDISFLGLKMRALSFELRACSPAYLSLAVHEALMPNKMAQR